MDGEPCLPRERTTGYRLSPTVRCDWDIFQHLAQQGLRKGPDTGLPDLEAALALVRGRPLNAGALPWATSLYHEIIARITDTAHTIATWHRTGPRQNLDAARRAIATSLDADDTAELLYQDWILTEDTAGNRAGVLHAIDTLQAVNRRLDVDMQPDTEAIISSIFGTDLSRT
ncbi:bacterial transcriptional activator domain-containing protein [Streptomyces luteireticuli]|uniref:Bacterial transcriptional activator domain-containing protein n=1 Tax=Streptomyces luteireticuli TaxID=173858 RepID=A0ABN0YXQ4_9ACTN